MKLRTRLLIFSSLFLVLLPWFGFHFIEKIEQSLLQGQEEAQSMVASAISTLLTGYTGIFDVDENALYVYPLENNIVIDGYDEDWSPLKKQFTSYAQDTFSLLLASDRQLDHGRYLYAYLKVNDKNIIYHHPRNVSLDSSDHIRLQYMDENNQRRRLILLTEGQGNISAYEVGKDWQTRRSAQHVNAVYGVWSETNTGYDVELRLSGRWLDPQRRLSFSVVNVYGENERYPDTIVSTHALPVDILASDILNPLLFQSQEITSVIKNLTGSDSRICVIDKYRRVRAVTGGQNMQASFCRVIEKVSETLVDKVLLGSKQVTRFEDAGENLIVAAHPVFADETIIGAVLVSKNSRQILALQRDTLKDIVLATLLLFVLVFISLLIFSSWLAYRINRLKNQTSLLVDERGRFVSHINLVDSKKQDEIGELSRSFSLLLDKLNSYTGFLETVPRMLRHEILNPVNTISMSLQSLQQHDRDSVLTQDISVAANAVLQLQLIVSSLTEAASIDDALTQDEVDTFDIAPLLSEYVSHSQGKHSSVLLSYQGVKKGAFVLGNDIRIVQLLDKIKDNAIDFALPGSEIIFQLEINQRDEVIIHIKNEGEIISQQQLSALFQGMVSHRLVKTDVPHLGIGLYVAYKIAQFHQGHLQIANRRDKQGVEVSLVLPLLTTV